MRAGILVPQSSTFLDARTPLLTYRVPEEFAATITPGQVVSVPFGERTVPGIVWALDAGEDAPDDESSTPTSDASAATVRLRNIAALLTPTALLLPSQRALAEWLANQYAAPLVSAVRLLLPPGLLSATRQVLRLREDTSWSPDDPTLTADERAVLGMLRERGWLDSKLLIATLKRDRARQVVRALRQRQLVTVHAELTGVHAHTQQEQWVRLCSTPEQLDSWRNQARRQLDTLPTPRQKRPAWQRVEKEERQAERLLRQLAVLDMLERPVGASENHKENNTLQGWRIGHLQKLTRVTPSALRELAKAGLIAVDEVQQRHDPLAGRRIAHTAPLALSPAQQAALNAIVGNVATDSDNPTSASHAHEQVFLLHGITGSGKTEVYLQALAAVLARGQRGIVLVPEIALTPQAMARFAGRFPGKVALLHSGLTPAERLDEWQRIHVGAVDIVLGSRSALFAPVDHLGLIIVDEEHEAAYKQDRTPTYHAREVAVALGRLTGATVVLGSATPSIESYWLATQANYKLLELRERAPTSAQDAPSTSLPSVQIVDLRAELRAGNTSILSEPLRLAVQQTLARGEQAILFLNRRGTASSVVCRECGYVARCGHCDVSMTYHASERSVLCHYCGRKEPVPVVCPICWSASIRYFGLGTERVEENVKRLFPTARVLRWDRDTARTRQVHEDLLRAFAERRADILVGTQMIAKGLDLPAVTLVGVISADVALFLPDFRASERAFQLLTQVAGRAGRGSLPGQVLVQTFNPEHFCIESAAQHDYARFFAAEVAGRERYGYPPFRRFVKCTYEHTNRYTAQVEATVLSGRLQQIISDKQLAETDIVGPAPAFMERLRGRYRWQLILRSPDPRPLIRALTADDLPGGWSIDVDPTSTL